MPTLESSIADLKREMDEDLVCLGGFYFRLAFVWPYVLNTHLYFNFVPRDYFLVQFNLEESQDSSVI